MNKSNEPAQLIWYKYSLQCQEMRAQARLVMCRLTRSFAVSINKVWIYRCKLRPEFLWLARLHQQEQSMDYSYFLICVISTKISPAGQIFI